MVLCRLCCTTMHTATMYGGAAFTPNIPVLSAYLRWSTASRLSTGVTSGRIAATIGHTMRGTGVPRYLQSGSMSMAAFSSVCRIHLRKLLSSVYYGVMPSNRAMQRHHQRRLQRQRLPLWYTGVMPIHRSGALTVYFMLYKCIYWCHDHYTLDYMQTGPVPSIAAGRALHVTALSRCHICSMATTQQPHGQLYQKRVPHAFSTAFSCSVSVGSASCTPCMSPGAVAFAVLVTSRHGTGFLRP